MSGISLTGRMFGGGGGRSLTDAVKGSPQQPAPPEPEEPRKVEAPTPPEDVVETPAPGAESEEHAREPKPAPSANGTTPGATAPPSPAPKRAARAPVEVAAAPPPVVANGEVAALVRVLMRISTYTYGDPTPRTWDFGEDLLQRLERFCNDQNIGRKKTYLMAYALDLLLREYGY